MSASLESRVARLERHNRALRVLLLLSGLAMVTCGSGISSSFERVDTNTLVIRSNDDQPRITLTSRGAIMFHEAGDPVVLDGKTLARLLAANPPATP